MPPALPPPLPQNATNIASRFRDLFGLELAAKQELLELNTARIEALEELQRLQARWCRGGEGGALTSCTAAVLLSALVYECCPGLACLAAT